MIQQTKLITILSLALIGTVGCQSAATTDKEKPMAQTSISDEDDGSPKASDDKAIFIDLKEMREKSEASEATVSPLNYEVSNLGDEKKGPHWMKEALAFSGDRSWQKIETSPSKPLRFFFKEKGVSFDWGEKLSNYEYYKLSTLTPYQNFFVAKNKEGKLDRFYTQKEAFEWLFVDIRDGMPVIHQAPKAEYKTGQLYVDSDTQWESLSKVQKRVLSQFLKGAKKELNKVALEMLQKGKVVAHYQSLEINNIEVRTSLVEVVAEFQGQQLIYRSEKRPPWL